MKFYQKHINNKQRFLGLCGSILFLIIIYYLCIYRADGYIDYMFGFLGVIYFSVISIILLYIIIINKPQRLAELTIDNCGIIYKDNNEYIFKWEDLLYIRIIYLLKGRIPVLFITLNEIQRKELLNKRKNKSLIIDRWLSFGDFGIWVNLFTPNAIIALEEIKKNYKGEIKYRYIL